MGKRELLLICAFATVGALVYSRPRPRRPPGEQGFSVSRIVEHVRREIHGNRSSAEVTTTTAIPLKPGVTEVRFETGNAPLTITGEDRADVLCELQVWSSGYDETEAKRYAGETALKPTEAGVSLVIGINYPEPATQRATLVVRMPKALAVRIQPSRGKLEIADVASRRARRGARRGVGPQDQRPADGHAPRRRADHRKRRRAEAQHARQHRRS